MLQVETGLVVVRFYKGGKGNTTGGVTKQDVVGMRHQRSIFMRRCRGGHCERRCCKKRHYAGGGVLEKSQNKTLWGRGVTTGVLQNETLGERVLQKEASWGGGLGEV